MDINELSDEKIRKVINECCDGIHEDDFPAIDCKMGLGYFTDEYGRTAQVQVIVTTEQDQWCDDQWMPK